MGRPDPVSHVCCNRERDARCKLVFTEISEVSEREGALIAARGAFALEAAEKDGQVREVVINHLIAHHLDTCVDCRKVRGQ